MTKSLRKLARCFNRSVLFRGHRPGNLISENFDDASIQLESHAGAVGGVTSRGGRGFVTTSTPNEPRVGKGAAAKSRFSFVQPPPLADLQESFNSVVTKSQATSQNNSPK